MFRSIVEALFLLIAGYLLTRGTVVDSLSAIGFLLAAIYSRVGKATDLLAALKVQGLTLRDAGAPEVDDVALENNTSARLLPAAVVLLVVIVGLYLLSTGFR